MIVITHCYPDEKDRLSGIWLYRAFNGFIEVLKISKWGFLNPSTYRQIRQKDVIACFVIPAGFIARVSSKSYILYCIGLDCFWIQRYKWLAWLCESIFKEARAVVYHSERVRQTINAVYGGKYDGQVIHTPVSSKEFYPKEEKWHHTLSC